MRMTVRILRMILKIRFPHLLNLQQRKASFGKKK